MLDRLIQGGIMKRALFIFILLLCVLCLTSCDRRSGKGLPSMFDTYLEPEEDFYLIVEYYNDLDSNYGEMRVDLVSKYRLQSLRLNETLLPIYGFSYLESSGAYSYSFDLSSLHGAFIGGYNEELAYQIMFERKTVSGLLQTPAEYSCEIPEFDNEQDYTVSWNLGSNPRAQQIDLSMYIDGYSHFSYSKKLTPSSRSYTLPKEMWNKLGVATNEDVKLQASNYQYTQGGLVWIISAGGYSKWSYNKQRKTGLERIQELINKEITLPK